MILKIEIDAVTGILHDLGTNAEFGVKIRAPGNRNLVVLQKGEDDSAPMCAKEFIDQVNRLENEKKDLCIVVEANIEGDKQKAWICDSDEDCDYVEHVTCSTDEPNKIVLLSFV